MDDQEANKGFADSNSFAFPLLCDTDLSVSKAYGAAAEGAAKSSRVAALVGPDGTVKKFWNPAGKGEFPAQVLAEL